MRHGAATTRAPCWRCVDERAGQAGLLGRRRPSLAGADPRADVADRPVVAVPAPLRHRLHRLAALRHRAGLVTERLLGPGLPLPDPVRLAVPVLVLRAGIEPL